MRYILPTFVSWYVTLNIRLARQNDTILNAQRSVTETEEVALEITQELSRNREKIDSAHGKVIIY